MNDHPSFPLVGNLETIWKFMDFTKYLSILEDKCMYFNRADSFKDPFEGTLPVLQDPDPLVDNLRSSVYINCWHVNPYESAGMWNLYLKNEEGIAIKSTGHRLKNCFEDQFNNMVPGKVKYVDYQTYIFPDRNLFNAVFHKRKSFQHEREARVCFENTNFPAYEDKKPEGSPVGMLVPTDVKILIESVYVSPDSPDWSYKLVKKVTKRYT
jgi:hypothetical protein